MSDIPYDPQRFVHSNFIDAMALISKEAWAMVGGYHHVRHGWEDYDFWCRMAELGLAGEWRQEIWLNIASSAASMLKQETTALENYRLLISNFEKRHRWVALIDREASRAKATPNVALRDDRSRLDALLPILRCPITKQKLTYTDDGLGLVTFDGLQRWPIVEGRAILAPDNQHPEDQAAGTHQQRTARSSPDDHRGNKGARP